MYSERKLCRVGGIEVRSANPRPVRKYALVRSVELQAVIRQPNPVSTYGDRVDATASAGTAEAITVSASGSNQPLSIASLNDQSPRLAGLEFSLSQAI